MACDSAKAGSRSRRPGALHSMRLSRCVLGISALPAMAPAGDPYDCNAGSWNWIRGWSDAKKSWCCEHKSVGCPSRSYDCSSASGSPRSWPATKRFWCCQQKNIGCEGDDYDCDAGYQNWQLGWSDTKKLWCCERQQRGCTKDHGEYSCNIASDMPSETSLWPAEQAMWCCRHWGTGCEAAAAARDAHSTVTTTNTGVDGDHDTFDCAAALWGAEDTWPEVKKVWCCVSEGIGCDLTSSSKPFDCEAGLMNWVEGWSTKKMKWCCDNEGLGCATTAGPGSYNCHEGGLWSEDKRKWCCKHEKMGCFSENFPCTGNEEMGCPPSSSATGGSATAAAAGNNAGAGTSATQPGATTSRVLGAGAGTSATQPAATTSTTRAEVLEGTEASGAVAVDFVDSTSGPASSNSGTPSSSTTLTTVVDAFAAYDSSEMATTTKAYDCNPTHTPLNSSWSPSQQQWCCLHTGGKLGCTTTTTTTTSIPFDCQAGLPNWSLGWSRIKKSWCCKFEGLGCPGGNASKPYDCWEGGEHSLWSNEKLEWCCDNDGVACAMASLRVSQPLNESTCLDHGIRYDPIDMFGTASTQENGIPECQKRCQRTMGCLHFTYFPTEGYCHIQDVNAVPGFAPDVVVSGPPQCIAEQKKKKPCYEVATVYYPVMPGLGVSFKDNNGITAIEVAKQCKALCAATEGCAHYMVLFPDRRCELADANAMKISRMRSVSGPPVCNRTLSFEDKFEDPSLPLFGGQARLVGALTAAFAVALCGMASVRHVSRSGTCRAAWSQHTSREMPLTPSRYLYDALRSSEEEARDGA